MTEKKIKDFLTKRGITFTEVRSEYAGDILGISFYIDDYSEELISEFENIVPWTDILYEKTIIGIDAKADFCYDNYSNDESVEIDVIFK